MCTVYSSVLVRAWVWISVYLYACGYVCINVYAGKGGREGGAGAGGGWETLQEGPWQRSGLLLYN